MSQHPSGKKLSTTPSDSRHAVGHSSAASHGTVRSYAIGYIISLGLTIGVYLLVTHHVFSNATVIVTALLLAIAQLLVQLFYFLHLHRAAKAPWNIIIFLFMALVVSIVVFGSLWIMQSLDYNMTRGIRHGRSPAQVDQYIQHDELITKDR